MSQLKIFVSYSWQDKLNSSIVKTIMNHLENDGWDTWIDVDDLFHGQHINETISEKLRATDLVLFMWSEHFEASKGCQHEVQTVFDLNVRFIPCQVSAHPLTNSVLGKYKWLDFYQPANLIAGVEWGWLQLRQYLLELEAEMYGTPEIKAELQSARMGMGQLENSIHRIRNNASSNDHSDPFLQQMMKMALQMAENDPENGEKYKTFCLLVSEISRIHPTQAEDRLKRQKLIGAIDIADPDGTLPVLQNLRMIAELSLIQG